MALLGPMLAVLGHSWGLCWRSWAALGTYVGGLGPVLGLTFGIMGYSWGLCWRFWAALGAYVGGLGTGSGRKAAQTRKSGPNPSGNRVPTGSGPPKPPRRAVRLPILSVDMYVRMHRLGSQERPQTVNIDPKSSPRLPAEAPRAASDRHVGSKSGPRLLT